MELANSMNVKVEVGQTANGLSVVVGIIARKFDFC